MVLEQQRSKARNVFAGLHQRCNNPNNPSYDRYCQFEVEFEFDDQWISWYYANQNCPLCNQQLTDGGRGKSVRTIDRKDRNGGYSYSNCQIICKSCNSRKGIELTHKKIRAAIKGIQL